MHLNKCSDMRERRIGMRRLTMAAVLGIVVGAAFPLHAGNGPYFNT
jgi:hypothetical protein